MAASNVSKFGGQVGMLKKGLLSRSRRSARSPPLLRMRTPETAVPSSGSEYTSDGSSSLCSMSTNTTRHFNGTHHVRSISTGSLEKKQTFSSKSFLQAAQIYDAHVKGMVSISNPVDVCRSVKLLTSKSSILQFLGDRKLASLYRDRYIDGCRRVFEKDSRLRPEALDLMKQAGSNVHEYDAVLTSSLWNLSNTRAYYKGASCGDFIRHLAHPSLFIHALDDPIVDRLTILETLPVACTLNPNILVSLTERGGHNMFVESILYKPELNYQARVVREYIESLMVMHKATSPPLQTNINQLNE
eukprot:GHVN01030936.1.p1 GENE.GHVN01030936.1~~GHVN01030936.1.p1  ORF type:complete len:349 (+),score=70.61 GHVN01030936.1:145-1047(+)